MQERMDKRPVTLTPDAHRKLSLNSSYASLRCRDLTGEAGDSFENSKRPVNRSQAK
jgi:hypothetical protein